MRPPLCFWEVAGRWWEMAKGIQALEDKRKNNK